MKNIVEFPKQTTVEQEAADWMARLDSDIKLSTSEHESFLEWINSNPEHREEFQNFAELWGDMNLLIELAEPGKSSKPKVGWTGFSLLRWAAVAATIVISISISITNYWYSDDPILESNGLYSSAIGEQKSINLADNSILFLNTNTQIKVDFSSGYRDVHLLQGEAHFVVAKDEKMPFRVFAGVGQIRAIGTAFSVYLKGSDIDITVSEGKVALSASITEPSVQQPFITEKTPIQRESQKSLGTLTAGQVATIVSQVSEDANRSSELKNLRGVKTSDLEKRLSWTQGVLVFSGESLEEVVKEISRYTKVSIEFSDPEIKVIRIGGRFPVGETEVMLGSLERDFGLNVTYIGAEHVLVSAGN